MFVLLLFKHSEEQYQSIFHYKHELLAQVFCTLVTLLFQRVPQNKQVIMRMINQTMQDKSWGCAEMRRSRYLCWVGVIVL